METNGESNNMIFVQNLKNLFEEISNSEGETKAIGCDGWIKIYNGTLKRLKKDNLSNEAIKNFLKGYHHFEPSLYKTNDKEKYSNAIHKADEVKYGANAIVLYFERDFQKQRLSIGTAD